MSGSVHNWCNKTEESNVKMYEDIKKIMTEVNDKQNKSSYPDALQLKANFKKEVHLIVKPMG